MFMGSTTEGQLMKKNTFELTDAERTELSGLLNKGGTPPWLRRRVQSILAMDSGLHGPRWSDRRISEAYGPTARTCESWRKAIKEGGVKSILSRKEPSKPRRAKTLTGEGQAQLTALACSEPPEGHVRWTLKLLANRLVSLEVVGSISDETVRRELKKTNLSLGK
jgi:transposase